MSRIDKRQRDLQEITSKIIQQSYVDPRSVFLLCSSEKRPKGGGK